MMGGMLAPGTVLYGRYVAEAAIRVSPRAPCIGAAMP